MIGQLNISLEINQTFEGAKEDGIAEGEAKGMAKGRIEERAENIKNMIKFGMPIEDIAQIIGLEISEIEELNLKSTRV
ncbi:hypothetical protein KKE26_07485 [bacterium]|nr:hypothetical protein [bacterium]MBU1752579.1 hypothetical protein [bacterium]